MGDVLMLFKVDAEPTVFQGRLARPAHPSDSDVANKEDEPDFP
jgi:hypothetical protein